MRRAAILAAGLLCALAPGAASPAEDGPGAARAPKEFFKGKVVSFKGRRIEIAYDFADPGQAEDWMPTYPFLSPPTSGGWRVEAGSMRGDGYAGYRHRAVFDGDVKLVATVSSEDAKNFGAVVLDEDHSQFTLFALADTVFSLRDHKPPLQHMVTTFLPAGSGPGGSTEWRYVQTAYEPRISSDPLEVTVRKKGALNEFRIGPSGRLAGADKEARVGPRMGAAFYTLGARVVVRKAVVSGVLDAAWLRASGIAFEDNVPEDTDPMEGEKGKDAGGASPDGRPAEGADWTALLRRVSDPAATKDDREKAADALAATKDRAVLRPLIDLLYSDTDPLARELAARVFRAVSGKETGYRAESPKEFRLKAMPRVWEVWYAVKEQLEKEEREKKAKEK
jgi:hypothetical protein